MKTIKKVIKKNIGLIILYFIKPYIDKHNSQVQAKLTEGLDLLSRHQKILKDFQESKREHLGLTKKLAYRVRENELIMRAYLGE